MELAQETRAGRPRLSVGARVERSVDGHLVRNLTRRFPPRTAGRRRGSWRSTTSRSRCREGIWSPCSGRAVGQEHDPADHRRTRGPRSGHRRAGGTGRHRLPVHRRGVGFVFQHYALFRHATVARQHRLRPRGAEVAARRDPGARGRAARSGPARGYADRYPASSPAASGSAWPWRGRWRRGPTCCCWTSRSARSMPRCAGISPLASPAARRGPHDERLRDARPGRGLRGRRRDRRDQPRPRGADRRARRRSTTIPRTEFVASFIGDVNVIEGIVTDGLVRLGPQRVPAPGLAVPTPAGEIVLLVRPEDIEDRARRRPRAGRRGGWRGAAGGDQRRPLPWRPLRDRSPAGGDLPCV